MKNTSQQEKLNNSAELDTKQPTMSALNNKNNNALRGILCILLSAFFYSLMSLFVRLAGDVPTFQKAFFRNIVATFVGVALLIKSGSFKMQKGSLPALLGRTIAGVVGVLCNFYAIDHMNLSDASILNKLAPFASVVFSIIILKEKASYKDLALVALAFCGALFVVKPTFSSSSSIPALIGVIGGLGAGLAYTFVRYLGKRGERNAYIIFFFSGCSGLIMLPLALMQYQPMTWMQTGWLLLAGVAASCAQFTVTAAYTYAPAKDISVYDYSQVLFTALWGGIFLMQFPDWWSVLGYAIIIGAAVLKYLLSRKK